ncbi:MAG TPA: hypothetical protein VI893_04335 [Thermoplasmata archaeon]|nr:hypothetical protein [Thermoplasmata archaeon]
MARRLRLTQQDTDLIRALNEARLDPTLIGGRAVILYGMPRHTSDTDFVVDLRVGPEGIGRLLDLLARMRYVPYGTDHRMDEGTFIAQTHVIFTGGGNVVDVWTRPAGWGLEMLGRRVLVRAGGLEVWVAHPEDLLRLKTSLKRPKDGEDIRFLKRLIREAAELPAPLGTIEVELVIEP